MSMHLGHLRRLGLPGLLARLALVGMTGPLVAAAALPGCGGDSAVVRIPKRDPRQKDAKQLLADARASAAAGKPDDADRSYSEAYTVAGTEANTKLAWNILVEWVDFLGDAGRHGRAHDVAKQYYDANPADPQGYLLYANALIKGSRGTEALDVSTQLVQLVGDAASSHDARGRALALVERLDEAAEELGKAVKLEPTTAKYHLSLGEVLHRLGQVDRAALEFRAALKASPDDPEANVLLGMALRDQGELDESKHVLDHALTLDPKNGRAYFELGVLYNRQLKQSDAQEAFAKAVKYAPNDSRFWYAYGEIFRVQERTEEAISAYRKAVELDPPFPKAAGKLGSTLVDKRQYDEAIPYLTDAARREPKNQVNYWYLGKAYAALGKNRQAIESYEQFLKIAPKDDADRGRAKDLINELKRR